MLLRSCGALSEVNSVVDIVLDIQITRGVGAMVRTGSGGTVKAALGSSMSKNER